MSFFSFETVHAVRCDTSGRPLRGCSSLIVLSNQRQFESAACDGPRSPPCHTPPPHTCTASLACTSGITCATAMSYRTGCTSCPWSCCTCGSIVASLHPAQPPPMVDTPHNRTSGIRLGSHIFCTILITFTHTFRFT